MSSRKNILNPSMIGTDSILGLDCSAKTIGWGLISVNPISLIAHGSFTPMSSKYSLIERLNGVFDNISLLCEELNPTIIAVEDIIQHMPGKSSAWTITLLAAFNRTAALAAWRKTKKLNFYPVPTIRAKIRKAINKKDKIDKKDIPSIIRENLCSNFSDIILRNGSISERTNDEADGIAVAWACALSLKESK